MACKNWLKLSLDSRCLHGPMLLVKLYYVVSCKNDLCTRSLAWQKSSLPLMQQDRLQVAALLVEQRYANDAIGQVACCYLAWRKNSLPSMRVGLAGAELGPLEG